ncbi:ABC transporter, permease protein [Aeromicrobium marinum DSM 15272]|uniref:ABC transporter, permease protein n=1 Tax=Aeromicrobium marinum DSM 15272 TaxID=585531 RepID=E2SEY5_9ACTN|nr:ABC transporter permease subunit [Aeromicrobium marinum]EFQ82229.1 ABC transporter, permease protein [Aeromicrobium marinum DSM 15272]
MSLTGTSTGATVVRRGLLLLPAVAVVGVFVVGGLATATLQSLGRQPLVGDPTWSLDAYRAVAADPAVRASLPLTLRISLLATALSLVLGVALALGVRRLAAGRRRFTVLLQSILAVPHLVGALCIALLLAPSGLVSRAAAALGLVDEPAAFPLLVQDGFGWGIVAEYVWRETPFVALVALAALTPRVHDLEVAARTLGAGRWQRLRRVTLPLLVRPVAAAGVLLVAFTLGSYEVPVLLGQSFPAPLSVVTYRSFTDTDLSARPEAMASAVVLTVLTAATAVAVVVLLRSVARVRR